MKKVLLWLIHFYQRFISPGRPPCCRFMPTCSAYALTAIERYGALRGGWIALRRICCCHPFYHGKRGIYDPVPEPENSRDLYKISQTPRIAPKEAVIVFDGALSRKMSVAAERADALTGGDSSPPPDCEKREFSAADEGSQWK